MFRLVSKSKSEESESFDIQFEESPTTTVNNVIDEILTRGEYGCITVTSREFTEINVPFGDDECYLQAPVVLLRAKVKSGTAVKTHDAIQYNLRVDD